MANKNPEILTPIDPPTSEKGMDLMLKHSIDDFLHSDSFQKIKSNNEENKKTSLGTKVFSKRLPRTSNTNIADQIVVTGGSSKYDTNYQAGTPGGKDPIRARDQGVISESINTLAGAILNTPFMLGQYTSAAFLPEDFKNVEDTTAKSIYDWFKNNADDVRETFPVYQRNISGFANAREYILSTLQQVGESAIPFLAIGAATSAAVGSTFGAASGVVAPVAGRIIQSMIASKIGADRINALRAVVTAANVGKSAVGLSNTLATAYALNRTEGLVEAADLYAQLYDEKKNELISDAKTKGQEINLESVEDEAKSYARIGAESTAKFNQLNLLLNLTSASRFVKPIPRSRMSFTPKTSKNIRTSIGLEMVQESAEELVNLMAQDYGETIAKGSEYGISNALQSILSDDGAHSAFAGALGGGIQTGLTEIISKKTRKYKEALANWEKAVSDIDEFKKSKDTSTLTTTFGDTTQKIKAIQDLNQAIETELSKPEENRNYSKIRGLENRVLHFQALNAFNDGAGQQLQQTYESLRDMSPEEATELGYDTDPDSENYYVNRANKALERIAELEVEYNYANLYNNKNDVFYNRGYSLFLEDEISDAKERVGLTSIIAEDRGREFFKDLPFDLSNLEDPVLMENPEYQKALEGFKRTVEFKVHNREQTFLNDVSNALVENRRKLDDLLQPETQEAVKRKAELEEKRKETKIRKAKEDKERAENELKLNNNRIKNQKLKLEELGYSPTDIKLMDDDTKTEIIKNKTKKTSELPQDGVLIGEQEEDPDSIEKEEKETPDIDVEGEVIPTISDLNKIANKVYEDGESSLTPEESSIFTNPTWNKIISDEIEKIRVKKDQDIQPTTVVPYQEKVPEKVTKEETKKVFEVLSAGKSDPNVLTIGKLVEYGHDKIAYLSRKFDLTSNYNPDGSIVITKEETTNLLNDNLFRALIDPKKFKIGTKLTLRPHLDYDGEITNPNGTGKLVWKELRETLDPNSEQYISLFPIGIYTSNNELVGYVHDLSWIQNPSNNLSATDPNDSKSLMDLRYTVLKNGQFETSVNFKSRGTLAVAKNGAKDSVSKRLPQSKIAIYTPEGLKGNHGLDENSNLVNQDYLVLGRTYSIVEMSDGSYFALPIDSDYMSESPYQLDSFAANMLVNFILKNQAFFDSMKDMGHDVSTFGGIRDFMSNFIYNYNFEDKYKNFQDFIDGLEKSDVPSNKTYFNFTGNAIEFGRPKSFVYKIFINPSTPDKITVQKGNSKSQSFNLGELDQSSLLMEAIKALKNELSQKGLNFSARKLGQKITIPRINDQGQIETAFDGTYDDFVKENTKTQFLSFNIGTEEEPNHVTAIQPVIRFNTTGTEELIPEAFNVVVDDTNNSENFQESSITVSGLNSGFKINTKNKDAFDPRNSITQPLIANDLSFAKIINKDNKEFIVLGLRVKDVDIKSSGRDGYVFATVENKKYLPNNIIDILTEKAKENIPNIYPNQSINSEVEDISENDLENKDTQKSIESKPTRKSKFNKSGKKPAKLNQTTGRPEIRPSDTSEDFLPDDEQSNKLNPESVRQLSNPEVVTPDPVQEEGKSTTQYPKYIYEKEQDAAFDVEDKNIKTGTTIQINEEGYDGLFRVINNENESIEFIPLRVLTSTKLIEQDRSVNSLLQYNDKVLTDFMAKYIVPGLSATQQYTIVKSLALHVNQALNKRESVKDLFDDYFNNELNYVIEDVESSDHVRVLNVVKNNRKAVERKVYEYIAKIRNARINTDSQDSELNNLEDNDQVKERTDFSDNYSISVNHKNTASGRLKAFFSSVRNIVNGEPEVNMFGLEEVLPFDFVYNNVQATLDGSYPDFNEMIEKLRNEAKVKPFMSEVADQLEQADQIIKNEFVKNMTKHGIQMKFLMWSFDKKTNGYKFTVYDSNSSSIQQVLISDWKSNLRNLDLVGTSETEGETILNKEQLQKVVDQFKSWERVVSPRSYSAIRMDKDIANFTPAITTPLKSGDIANTPPVRVKQGSSIKEGEERVGVFGDRKYILKRVGDVFEISPFDTGEQRDFPTATELSDWFKSIGIHLNELTVKDLVDGNVYFDVNKDRTPYRKLFSKEGALNIFVKKNLENRLKHNLPLEANHPFDDSIIKNIAKRESTYALNKYASSFRTAGKSIATFTNNNFLMNRIRDLKNERSPILNKVLNNPFGRHNFILSQFTTESEGTHTLIKNDAYHGTNIHYASLEVMKRFGGKPRDNRELHKLSPLEQEITRLNFFTANDNVVNVNGFDSRKVILPLPTMSDKTRVMLMEFYARVFKTTSDGSISDDTANDLFNHLVLPEIERMKAYESGARPDIRGYNAHRFYLLPFLNNVDKIFLNDRINPAILDTSDIKREVISKIKNHFKIKVDEKIKEWDLLGVTNAKKLVEKGIINTNLINQSYLNKVMNGDIRRVATDYVLNNYLMNMSVYQMIIGDPAMYAKSPTQDVEAIFDNVGKRLAMLIAPGSELAGSNNPTSTFNLAVVKDTELTSRFNDYFQSLGYDYSGITSGDAQEYTTWREHLRVLRQDGKISPDDFKTVRGLLTRGLDLPKNLLKVVLKPIKPVYVESTYDENGIEKRYYVKSSSIPLIPQLTRKFQIDKLRKSMESKKIDRVAYESAVKVGIGNNVDQVFDENGDIIDNIEFKSMVTLPRSGFRIQQEIPNKDKIMINDGTQQRQMLFLNMDEVPDFKFNGKSYTGKQLKGEYNNIYKLLFVKKYNDLINEVTLDGNLNIEKLRDVIMNEAHSRGFSSNAIESLELSRADNGELRFSLPLWLSPHADTIEALLNSIVKNRVIKNPMPGMSLVLASENGFKLTYNTPDISGILLTDRFDGQLKPQRVVDGVVKYAQVFVPERLMFKGKRINLREFLNKDGRVDVSTMGDALFEMFGFRIPTQGPNSMVGIEIVGFLPESMGDIIIAPMEFVKQMGSDFDVDKLYSYNPATFTNKGQIYKLKRNNRHLAVQSKLYSLKENLRKGMSALLSKEYILQDSLDVNYTTAREFILQLAMAHDEVQTKEVIAGLMNENNINPNFYDILEEQYNKLDESYIEDLLDELILKNDIFDIHMSVMGNPDPRVQGQITQPLGFGDLKKDDGSGLDIQITELKKKRNNDTGSFFSPLSDQYQKMKFQGGTAGKSGTAVYSTASVFNTAIQSDLRSEQVILRTLTMDENGKAKYVPYQLSLFGKKTDGNLASSKLIDSDIPKSQSFAAFQSASVDNEKERILEKLNINDVTFPVTNIMMQLGFNETIVVHLINQPIIEDYVRIYQSLSGPLDGFLKNIDSEVARQVLALYPSTDNPIEISDISLEDAKLMISGEYSPDGFNDAQREILSTFLELQKFGIQLQSVTTTINSDSKGIPINISETGDKVNKLLLLDNNKTFYGISRLIGDYIKDDKGNVTNINPTTIKGFASVFGVMGAYDLFGDLFPFGNYNVESIFTQINNILGIDLDSPQALSNRKLIYDNIKSYIYSIGLPIYRSDTKTLRSDLLMDTKINKSLASFLSGIKDTDFVVVHPFLSKLRFDLGSKGSSFYYIEYDAASNEDLDESIIHTSFVQMLLDNSTIIGKRNGINITPKRLAEDLVAYSFLVGGKQDAKNFMKYIPVAYLKATGMDKSLSDLKVTSALFGLDLANPEITSTFTRQFIQNNPNLVQSFDIDQINLDSDTLENSNTITLKTKSIEDFGSPEFITVRKDGTLLFEKQDSGGYNKIPILGERKSSEYYFDKYIPTSVIPTNNPKIVKKSEVPASDNIKDFLIDTYDKPYRGYEPHMKLPMVLNNMKTNDYYNTLGSIMTQSLIGKGVNFELVDDILTSEEVFNETGRRYGKGVYNVKNNIIKVATNMAKSQPDFEHTLLHETTHALTSNILRRYSEGNITELSNIEINFAKNINTLYQYAKEKMKDFDYSGNSPLVKHAFFNEREFVAILMTNSEFQKIMNSILYKDQNKTLLDKLVDIINKLISDIAEIIGTPVDSRSVLYATINEVITLTNPDSVQDNYPDFSEDIDSSYNSTIIYNNPTEFDYLANIVENVNESPTERIKKLCQ